MTDITYDQLKLYIKESFFQATLGTSLGNITKIMEQLEKTTCKTCTWNRLHGSLALALKDKGLNLVNSTMAAQMDKHVLPQPTKQGRIPCMECVKKHVNQAYILSAEYYQGYTRYKDLVEGHLTQALSEAPAKFQALQTLLDENLKRLTSTGKPYVARDAIMTVIEAWEGVMKLKLELAGKEKDLEKLNNMSTDTGETEKNEPITVELTGKLEKVSEIDENTRNFVINLLEKAQKTENQMDWIGYMAVAADLISQEAPVVANYLRNRRLAFAADIYGFKDPTMPGYDNKDVIDWLKAMKTA